MNRAFLRKHWSNILLVVFIVLLFIPQTGKPIRVFFHRLMSFAPSVEDSDSRERVDLSGWLIKDQNGKIVSVEGFKDKKILINYWATWCPPCIAEMPDLQALYEDFGEDVVFLFITGDESDRVNKFMTSRNFDFPVYYYFTQVPALLSSNKLPTTYLIDENQEIVIEKIGAAKWNSEKVRELLKKE